MTSPVRITAPKDLAFLSRVNHCFGSTPALNLEGYCMEFLVLPSGAEYPLFRKTVSISVLEGALENPALKKYETDYYPTREGEGGLNSVKAAAESLLFLAYDTTERNDQREYDKYAVSHILGPNIHWIDVEKKPEKRSGPGKRYRTDPKIEIRGNIDGKDVHWRMNLWYLIKNLNGGIHNHAKDMPKFREFHVGIIGGFSMVVYNDDKKTDVERIPVSIGYGHRGLWLPESQVTYQYHAAVTGDKGALFAALEEICQ